MTSLPTDKPSRLATTEQVMSVEEFLKSDRQWPRELRLKHAQYQLRNAITEKTQTFWLAVIKANRV